MVLRHDNEFRAAEQRVTREEHRPTIMVSAGEASGDAHAAEVLAALAISGVNARSFGMGAGRLESAGMELLVDCRDLAVIGIVDVLLNYHRFLLRLARLRKQMRQRKPDLLVLVDYPDFNLKLAETARSLGIPVLFYVSPQVWAWRSGRIKRIASLVSHMAVLFPFEVDVYKQAGVPVTYVGNPLVDDATSPYSPLEARQQLALDPDTVQVALLPGSRSGELSRNLPVMLDAAATLHERQPGCCFVLPVAPTLSRTAVEALVSDASVPVKLVDGQSKTVLRAADVALVASGTATLETALLGTPMAIIYVIHPLNYAIMSRLIRIDNIGLVNIVAGRRVAAEFVQHDAKPAAIAAELERLLLDLPYRQDQLDAFAEVSDALGDGGASKRVAGLISQMLG